ncbi:Replication factor-A carboxy-terminal domain protein [Arachis hypogaea]|uniref:Replication factor-A carboxy-terminal domain protein n=1 Tax=Arachis hypogaea TaxID=3818 RepID=A0A6B9V4P9_ARAHY|nr:Replication factor-A carboxy-terminal domain protein [Arachis hypogaea]
MHPPRETWRVKVRVLRFWVVPSFGNHEVPNSMEMILLDEHCEKIQATVKKQLLNRFRDHIVEGQVYRMAYFTVVSNHGSYRATSHKFKLVFLHRTTVVAVDEDVILKTCFNLLCLFGIDTIGLLTAVGEEKEYAKKGKIVKTIVLELISKDLTMRCALFGDYANQVNHFLASGYVELFLSFNLQKSSQVGLQNVMYANQMLFNPDLSEGIYPQNGAYYYDFCVKHITNVTPRFKIKITLEDHSGEGIFVFFNREASYLFKKSCADLFTEVQKDASLICGDTYPPIFQGLIGKKLLLKVDTKGVRLDKFFGTFRVRRVCDDPTIIAMFELPDYDANDESTPKKEPELKKPVSCEKGDTDIKKESSSTSIKRIEVAALINDENRNVEKTIKNDTLSDDFSSELDILLSSPVKETQEVFSQVLKACSHYGEKVIHEDHVVTSKGKRNLNPQFDEEANDANGRGSKIAKVDRV